MDRVFAVHTGSQGLDSNWQHVRTIFSNPIDKDIHTQYALSWKIVVSEWRSVTAVSLAVASTLSNWQNCTCACKTLQSQGQTHSAGCGRPWFCTTEPLWEHCYDNWITTYTKFQVATIIEKLKSISYKNLNLSLTGSHKYEHTDI